MNAEPREHGAKPPAQTSDYAPTIDGPIVPVAASITGLLTAAAGGEPGAVDRLMTVVYDELRAIAQVRLNHEHGAAGHGSDHTLQATALVSEVYLRLIGRENVRWEGRGHFFRAAAEAMRKILIDHARKRNANKRGAGRPKAALDISNLADAVTLAEGSDGLLALDGAIVRLEGVDAQAAEVVRLRFYAGLNDEAVAGALGISERTVRRDWAFARAWLRDAIEVS